MLLSHQKATRCFRDAPEQREVGRPFQDELRSGGQPRPTRQGEGWGQLTAAFRESRARARLAGEHMEASVRGQQVAAQAPRASLEEVWEREGQTRRGGGWHLPN